MSTELWQQLIEGKSLGEVGVPKIDGRFDLRNLRIPDPHAIETLRLPCADVTLLDGITSIKGATWQSIDFSSSRLPALRLSDCQIRDCVFDRCRMDDLRVWRTDFANVSFRSADLRGAVLGGTSENDSTRNRFHDVDFTGADMRGSIYGAAEFVRCKFNQAKLKKVDFQSSAFTDCSFEGELREVVFNRTGFRLERFPPNELKRVDFRRAKLRECEFRGLDLDEVFFPEDDDHIVIDSFPETLDRLLTCFRGRPDLMARVLVVRFENDKKWLGSRRRVGVLNKQDLIKWAGEEGLKMVLQIIGSARRPQKSGAG